MSVYASVVECGLPRMICPASDLGQGSRFQTNAESVAGGLSQVKFEAEIPLGGLDVWRRVATERNYVECTFSWRRRRELVRRLGARCPFLITEKPV